jgi:hypothetical protein
MTGPARKLGIDEVDGWSLVKKLAAKAAERDIPWHLSDGEYRTALGDGVCHWCDARIWGNGVGLDRIDNACGYELGNVVPCCPSCNMERRTLSYAEYMAVWNLRRMAAKHGLSDGVAAHSAALAALSSVRAGHAHHSVSQGDKLPLKRRDPEWRALLARRAALRSVGINPDNSPSVPERAQGETMAEHMKRCGLSRRKYGALFGMTEKYLRIHENRRVIADTESQVTVTTCSHCGK